MIELKSNYKSFLIVGLILVLILSGVLLSACDDPEVSYLASFPLEKALANGKPTLAEFGWRKCIPCKDMRPILEELDREYKNQLNVLIVEIPLQEALTEKYGVNVMPVQIFFDNKGKEIARHAGFLPKSDVLAALQKMGVKK
jgi:thioredoxin 1